MSSETLERRVCLVVGLIVPDSQSCESSGNDRLIRHDIEFITRDLFTNELVVRLSALKRVDDIITVSPGKRLFRVRSYPWSVQTGPPREPMPSPAFRHSGTGQQLIEKPFKSVGTIVREKVIDFGTIRRETDQIEIRTANQITGGCLRRRLNP